MYNVDKLPSVLALVPARKGSKGLPGKNSKNLGGFPLISWTLIAASNSKFLTKIVVSSDDPLILKIASEYGIESLIRPPELCTDNATARDVIKHALSNYPNFDYIVYLQPTSPFRSSINIDEAIELALANFGKSVISVRASSEYPELMYRQEQNGTLVKLLNNQEQNRQHFPIYLVLNGSIYIAPVSLLSESDFQFDKLKAIPYQMSNLHSLDIDTDFDFQIAEKAVLDGLKPH